MLNHIVAHDTAPCFKCGDPNPKTLPGMTEAGASDLTTADTMAGLFAALNLAGVGGLEPLVPETSALAIELRSCRKGPAATRRSSGYSMYRLRWSPDVSLAATRPIPFGGHEHGLIADLRRAISITLTQRNGNPTEWQPNGMATQRNGNPTEWRLAEPP